MSTHTGTNIMTDQQRAYVRGLRDLADFIERTPALIPEWGGLMLNLFADDEDELRRLGRELGGRRTKDFYGDWAFIHRRIGPHEIAVNIRREKVCERVVVGTREVEAEEIVEWRCHGFDALTGEEATA